MLHVIEQEDKLTFCVKTNERPALHNLCRVTSREKNHLFVQYVCQGRYVKLEKIHVDKVIMLEDMGVDVVADKDENGILIRATEARASVARQQGSVVKWAGSPPHSIYLKAGIVAKTGDFPRRIN